MDPKVTLVETIDELNEFWRWLGQRRPILGLDTETTGLEWWTPGFLRTTQFGDSEQAYVLPQNWWGKAVKDAVEGYDGYFVGQNLKFEAHAFASAGIKMPMHKLHDTHFLGWLSNPMERAGLKPLATKYVDPLASVPEYILMNYFKKNGWNRSSGWRHVPVTATPYWFYGGWDPIITCRVWEHLQSYRGQAYDLEMELLPLVTKMERAGMYIDHDYVSAKRAEWREEMDHLLEKCREYGLNNPGSGMQVEAALKAEGWEPEDFTETGRAKLDKKILSGIPHEIGDLVIQYKRLQKWDSSYLKNFQVWDDNGRLHANIKQCEARTGRMSVTNPALQTIPRGPVIRNCFIPSEGNVLITADYAQIELRMLAHYSQDARMIQQFMDGEDLHNNLAASLFGPNFTSEQRTVTKNTWFSKAYGASVETFAETAGIPVEQAASIYAGLDETYPGIAQFQNSIIDIGKARQRLEGRGYVRLSDGTELPSTPGEEYALVDYALQGESAKILKRAAVQLDNAGIGDYLRMFVHDEVILDVPKDIAEDVLRKTEDIMTVQDGYAVPIIVEGAVCPTSWGSKYE